MMMMIKNKDVNDIVYTDLVLPPARLWAVEPMSRVDPEPEPSRISDSI